MQESTDVQFISTQYRANDQLNSNGAVPSSSQLRVHQLEPG
jgi:hypothetical protein